MTEREAVAQWLQGLEAAVTVLLGPLERLIPEGSRMTLVIELPDDEGDMLIGQHSIPEVFEICENHIKEGTAPERDAEGNLVVPEGAFKFKKPTDEGTPPQQQDVPEDS